MGSSPAGAQESIRFGEDFEVDLRALELRHVGRPLKLERIPLQVLVILIEQKGQLVTREEIAEKIWGKDVYLDTDNSINGAVRKIRQVLKDDPQDPRFVQTLPGRGYRFIAPVSGEVPGPRAVDNQASETYAAPAGPNSGETRTSFEEKPAAPRHRLAWLIALSCVGTLGLAASIGWHHFYGKGAAPPIRSLAVLPLQNLSGDPSQDYFADGMTEELITELARIQSLRVISHTSVMDYKGTKKHLPQIAQELGVDAILEGSVIRESSNVRVTVQLLDGPADRHLWGEEYERPLNGVLNLQRDLGRAIAQEVRAKLSTPQSPVRPAHVVVPAANDDYMKGRIYFDNGFNNPDSLRKAQQYYEHSIQTDPNFAQPYAGLANTYIYLAFAGVVDRDWAYRSAKSALAKAMELDDTVGEAHDTLGTLKLAFEGDSEGAEREYKRAIALAPSFSCGHEDLASLLASQGRREEALAEVAKIDQVDFSIVAASVEQEVYYTLRDYPNLILAGKRVLLFDSNNPHAHHLVGVGFEATGNLPEAISEFQKAVDLSKGDPDTVVSLAHALSASGKKAEARKLLLDLQRKLSAARGTSPYLMATIYAELGEKDKAFDYLNRALRERSFELSGRLKSDPAIDTLRNDPRFHTLMNQVGFPLQ